MTSTISGRRPSGLMPLKMSDAIMKITKADDVLLKSIDSPARLEYHRRIELAGGDRQLGPGPQD